MQCRLIEFRLQIEMHTNGNSRYGSSNEVHPSIRGLNLKSHFCIPKF